MKKLRSFLTNISGKRMISTWPTTQPKWNEECLKLLQESSTGKLPESNLKTIIEKSKEFPIKFPKNTMICQNLLQTVGEETLNRNIKSVYPVIHEHSLYLCAKFLLFKRNHGTEKEKTFYKDISLLDLIQRLLAKRAVSFITECDSTRLLDNSSSYGLWDTIGTNEEKNPLVLENYISYDEIKLSALLSVSSYTYFINDGNRSNGGIVEPNRDQIEKEGIIIGLIGTRFERENKMEFEEIIVSQQQNTSDNGYGPSPDPSLHKVFAEVYEEPSLTYNKKLDSDRFFKIDSGTYFDNVAFTKRLALSFDTLLIEANHRARERSKTAYIHVVGIGLGAWKISSHQTQLFVDTFGERMKFLGKNLSNVSDIHFAYISEANHCLDYKNEDVMPIEDHPNAGIKIHISNREPHTTLSDEGKLLVVSYAWDGNALPGNEFWIGMLKSTGDPSTACSTQITEIHNPHINPLVCAENLHIAMLDGTVKHIKELAELRKN